MKKKLNKIKALLLEAQKLFEEIGVSNGPIFSRINHMIYYIENTQKFPDTWVETVPNGKDPATYLLEEKGNTP